jgi:hypothetical protein
MIMLLYYGCLAGVTFGFPFGDDFGEFFKVVALVDTPIFGSLESKSLFILGASFGILYLTSFLALGSAKRGRSIGASCSLPLRADSIFYSTLFFDDSVGATKDGGFFRSTTGGRRGFYCLKRACESACAGLCLLGGLVE